MSNTSTYITFSALDYKGESSLSSYSLPITPFTLIPDLNKGYDKRVVWDFGDGTTSKSFSAKKYYEFPGVYTVRLIVFDCRNNAMISSIEKSLTVKDYTPFTMSIEMEDQILLTESSEEISNELSELLAIDSYRSYSNFVCKNGKIEGAIYVDTYFPSYQPPVNIFYSVSGSKSDDYWSIKNDKFSHLENFYTFYDKTYNYAISSYQYREIDKISPITTGIYVKLENNTLVPCGPSDSGACLAGLSARNSIYFKDDSITDSILFTLKFDKTNLYLPSGKINYINNLGVSILGSVIENDEVDHLSITSNGLDGEGYQITTFNISDIKFIDTLIPFVVKIKDIDNFSVKNFNPIQLSSINISLTADNAITYTLSSLNYTLSSQNHGGSLRGYVKFSDNGLDVIKNVKLLASGTFTNSLSSNFALSGESNAFNVYKSDYYDMFKVNEDFNPEQTLKDLRFQEILLDKKVLFEDFLGSILGNSDSSHEAIGITIYEKIANIVQNTQDVDASEQEFLNSLAQMMGYNDINEVNYTYPESIKRLMNLASVDKAKLIGELNKFSQNFDIKGRTTKTEYGINLGDQVDPYTYVCSVSTPIVALEKFSNSYTLLNTYQPLSSVNNTHYALSTFSLDWGWPLVLPDNFIFSDIEKYYLFFEYNPQYDNTTIGGIIDFKSTKTTVSPSATNTELFGQNGIFQHMFLDTLYQSLSLIGQ